MSAFTKTICDACGALSEAKGFTPNGWCAIISERQSLRAQDEYREPVTMHACSVECVTGLVKRQMGLPSSEILRIVPQGRLVNVSRQESALGREGETVSSPGS